MISDFSIVICNGYWIPTFPDVPQKKENYVQLSDCHARGVEIQMVFGML